MILPHERLKDFFELFDDWIDDPQALERRHLIIEASLAESEVYAATWILVVLLRLPRRYTRYRIGAKIGLALLIWVVEVGRVVCSEIL